MIIPTISWVLIPGMAMVYHSPTGTEGDVGDYSRPVQYIISITSFALQFPFHLAFSCPFLIFHYPPGP